uniref:Uncharacterized protein n=1 Tax=Tetraselmis chuii TaxID=63592 RepID=A0A7S1SHM9_9CHLO|mmetsp:Transcript_12014/g.21635  ORF Transcript_12014/g.21635 Transcript_12014/m.21635 type:complete len:104 (+) Transcript_12014:1120-1431(+)
MWHSGSPTPDDSKRIRVNGGAMMQQLDSLKRKVLKRVTPLYLELLDPDGCFLTCTGATQNIMDHVKQQYYVKFGRKSEAIAPLVAERAVTLPEPRRVSAAASG